MTSPEARARVEIDNVLAAAGWHVCDYKAAELYATLTGVERQSARYLAGLPSALPNWSRPLPFAYKSTYVETRFTMWGQVLEYGQVQAELRAPWSSE